MSPLAIVLGSLLAALGLGYFLGRRAGNPELDEKAWWQGYREGRDAAVRALARSEDSWGRQ
jgi:hypothetical protein